MVHDIAGAMEEYGESAVFDVVARFGDYTEIVASFNIDAGKKIEKIARYRTRDGITFEEKEVKEKTNHSSVQNALRVVPAAFPDSIN
jgi:hypothetical protein